MARFFQQSKHHIKSDKRTVILTAIEELKMENFPILQDIHVKGSAVRSESGHQIVQAMINEIVP
jgi:hypothetical protein